MLARWAMIAVGLTTASLAAGDIKPLDPSSEEPLRDQIQRLMQPATRPAFPTTQATLESELDEKIRTVEREINRLRALGDAGKARAEDLSQRLQPVHHLRSGTSSDEKQPELHVVSVQGIDPRADKKLTPAQRRRQFKNPGIDAVIDVQPTGRPIVLALNSYAPVRWDVRIAEGAAVERILVGGYENQEVVNAPKGIPLEIHTCEGRHKSPSFFYGFNVFGGPVAEFETSPSSGATKLRALTPLPIATLLSPQRYRGEPIVVGPGNREWVSQRALTVARPLAQEAAAYAIAEQREAVREVRFKAVRMPPPDVRPLPGPAAAARGMRVIVRPAVNAIPTMCDFSPAGPIEGSDVPLVARATHVAVDPVDGTIYTAGEVEAHRIDPKTRVPARIQPNDAELPRMSQCTGVTIDTKRRRVIFATQRMLYVYDPVTEKWSGLVDLEYVRVGAFAYSEAHDCLYALMIDMGIRGKARIVRYTPEGDADQLIELAQPITLGRMFGPDATPQLIPVGEQLAVITAVSRFDLMRIRAAEEEVRLPRQRCYLVHPKTGEMAYGGPLEPQPAADAPAVDLDEAWNSFTGDEKDVERITTALVSGRDRAVDFLRNAMLPVTSPTTATAPSDLNRIGELIARLDHDDFAERNEASRQLRRIGPVAEPALKDALAKTSSAEAKSRIDTLLSALQPEPVAPGERKPDRNAIAISALGRIGTPGAIALLGDLAAGPAGAPRTQDARAALREFVRED